MHTNFFTFYIRLLFCFFCSLYLTNSQTFDTLTLGSPKSGETNTTITSLTNAQTQTYFAFRSKGKTKWINGFLSPAASYFSISSLRKVTATSATSGTVTLPAYTMSETLAQEVILVAARQDGWSLSVTSTSYALDAYPIAATSSFMSGVTFKNIDSFIFGSSSKGFSKARKTSTGKANYGMILATRIIGLKADAPYNALKCRVRLNATGILFSVLLGSDLIISDSSNSEGKYYYFTSGAKYLFTKPDYQLLSIFGSIELDVNSTNLVDCEMTNGTYIGAVTPDIYSISSKTTNATTTKTVTKGITCFAGCDICDKSTSCLATTCLLDPNSASCLTPTTQNCPAQLPYFLDKTTMQDQCMGKLANKMMVKEITVSTAQIIVGPVYTPVLALADDVDQYCYIYAEIGTIQASNKVFFPANFPQKTINQVATASSRLILRFSSYAYNPNFPFAPKRILVLRLGPQSTTTVTMMVRNLTGALSPNNGFVELLDPTMATLTGFEFEATTEFNVKRGSTYMVEFHLNRTTTTARLAIRIPADYILLFSDGYAENITTSGGVLIYYPYKCGTSSPCFVHIVFNAIADGSFKFDPTLLTGTGLTLPFSRPIKDIAMESDGFCPPLAKVFSNPKLCECDGGYKYINGQDIKCIACHSSCLTCSGALATNCLSCRAGYILTSGKCIVDPLNPPNNTSSGGSNGNGDTGSGTNPDDGEDQTDPEDPVDPNEPGDGGNSTNPSNNTDPNNGTNTTLPGDNGNQPNNTTPEGNNTNNGGNSTNPSNNTDPDDGTNTTLPGDNGNQPNNTSPEGNNTNNGGNGNGTNPSNNTDPNDGTNTTLPGDNGNQPNNTSPEGNNTNTEPPSQNNTNTGNSTNPNNNTDPDGTNTTLPGDNGNQPNNTTPEGNNTNTEPPSQNNTDPQGPGNGNGTNPSNNTDPDDGTNTTLPGDNGNQPNNTTPEGNNTNNEPGQNNTDPQGPGNGTNPSNNTNPDDTNTTLPGDNGNQPNNTSPEGNNTNNGGNGNGTNPSNNTDDGTNTTLPGDNGNQPNNTSPEGNNTNNGGNGNGTNPGNNTNPDDGSNTTLPGDNGNQPNNTSPEGNNTNNGGNGNGTNPDDGTNTTLPGDNGNQPNNTTPEGNNTNNGGNGNGTNPSNNTDPGDGNNTTLPGNNGNQSNNTTPEGNSTNNEPPGENNTNPGNGSNPSNGTTPDDGTNTTLPGDNGNQPNNTTPEGNNTNNGGNGNGTNPSNNTDPDDGTNTTLPGDNGNQPNNTSPEGNNTNNGGNGNGTNPNNNTNPDDGTNTTLPGDNGNQPNNTTPEGNNTNSEPPGQNNTDSQGPGNSNGTNPSNNTDGTNTTLPGGNGSQPNNTTPEGNNTNNGNTGQEPGSNNTDSGNSTSPGAGPGTDNPTTPNNTAGNNTNAGNNTHHPPGDDDIIPNNTNNSPGDGLHNSNDGRNSILPSLDSDYLDRFSGSWIKLFYLLFYAISFISGFLYMKKLRTRAHTIVYSEASREKTRAKRDPDSNQAVFINYNALLFLMNDRLDAREKSTRVFHSVFMINTKLFLLLLMARAFSQDTFSITTADAQQNLAAILVCEIVVTALISLIYSRLFRVFRKRIAQWFIALSIISVGMILGIGIGAVNKLENGAGGILIGCFALSVLISYVLIEALLVIPTKKSGLIRRMRKYNVYKTNDNKVQVISVGATQTVNSLNVFESSKANYESHRVFKQFSVTPRDVAFDSLPTLQGIPTLQIVPEEGTK